MKCEWPHCLCSNPTSFCAALGRLTPQQNGGFPTEHCNDVKHSQGSQPNLYQMITEQNPERRSEQRKPVTSFDWELTQALNHLQNAISVTDSASAHKLIADKNIIKGVRESD